MLEHQAIEKAARFSTLEKLIRASTVVMDAMAEAPASNVQMGKFVAKAGSASGTLR
jgi:hypothetical protein